MHWEPGVRRQGNKIVIQKLDHPAQVSNFIKTVQGLAVSRNRIEIDASAAGRVFPNASVPIAAIIQRLKEQGVDVVFSNLGSFLTAANFEEPLIAAPEVLSQVTTPLSRIWRFQDERMVSSLVTALTKAIAERIECQPGVLEALEWCLNEVMDNVFQHAMISQGFAMVQVHPQARNMAICISDMGIGIFRSLKESAHRPRTPVDAITLAVKEGVTRDPRIGQGNGLWGLLQIVRENSGRLSITSGSGSLFIRGAESKTFSKLPYLDCDHQGTIVDFQIDVGRRIDIARALGGHTPVNLRLESLENERGEYILKVAEHAHGTGTRRAAEQMRNMVINVINEGASRVGIDFSGVAIISSSFADELVGKLVVRYGFVGFQQAVRLSGMNEYTQSIVHRAVAQRMMEGLEGGGRQE